MTTKEKRNRPKDRFSDICLMVSGIVKPDKDLNHIEIAKAKRGWKNMLVRSFGPIYKEMYPSYVDVTMCDEWKDYSVYKAWYDDNYYEIPGHVMHIDKDLLIPGNNLYTAVFHVLHTITEAI